jgi:ring-1,2-phenylacetyl-CoA epoxidase subunit PaaC
VAWLPEVLEHPRLGPTAAKILREEHFHVTYSRSWVGRLAESAEGHRRLQQALEELWPLAQQLLAPGGFVDPDRLRQNWQLPVAQELQHMGLTLPLGPAFQPSDRRLHTEHLWSLLAELQSVARSDPEARVW